MIREENGVQIITLTVPGGEVSVVPHFYFIFSNRSREKKKRKTIDKRTVGSEMGTRSVQTRMSYS